MVAYDQARWYLDPKFDDCPGDCPLTGEQDRTEWCEGCEHRPQWDMFAEDFENERLRRFEGEAIDWSFDNLYGRYLEIADENERVRGKGYPRGCDLVTARLLDIFRAEQRRPNRIRTWNDWLKGQQEANK